jgi:peptide/nickel transport system substrate-binding protein
MAAMAALLAAAACSNQGTTTGTSAGTGKNGTVTMAVEADPGKINPITNATQAGQEVAAFTYESLLDFPTGRQPVGGLAASWQISTTKAVFTLKKGVTCSDGTALKAGDVAATFDYAEKPATGSPYAGVYFPASGMKVSYNDAAGTVTFVVPQAESFLDQTLGSLPIVCGAGLKDPSTLNTKAYGTGPYTLTSANPGQSYTFTLRKDYTWGPGGVTSQTKGLPKKVVAQVVTDSSTRASLLQSGGVQLASVTGTDRNRLSGTKFATTTSLDLRPGLVFFNQASGRPGNSLAVRQAIAAAINSKAVGGVASEGRGQQIVNLVPNYPTLCPGQNSASALTAYNVSQAESLLTAQGWKAGAGGKRYKNGKELTVKLLYPSTEGAGATAAIELMQQELAAVGINGVPTPSSSYTDVIFSGGDWDLVYAPIYTSLPSDWQGILSGDFPPKGGNWTYNTNKQYFQLADQAQQHAGQSSCPYWTRAQNSLFTNLEVLPLYSATTTIYGSGVTFGLSKTIVDPTTMRVAS